MAMQLPKYDIKAGTQFPLGADQDGIMLNLIPGLSSGFGRSFVSIKKAGVGLVSGTTENTLVNGLIIGGFKTLIDNTAVNILQIVVANNTSASGLFIYTVDGSDGADFTMQTGVLIWQIVNKAGTFTTNIVSDFNSVNKTQIRTTGTLMVTFALSSANPSLFSVNANTSLTPAAGRLRIDFSILNLSNQEITLL